MRRAKSVVGGGALLAGQLVLTCAHVVNAALGRPRDASDYPHGAHVLVDFPLQGADPIEAEVVAWSPLGAFGEGDVAVLRLTAQPTDVSPMSLVTRVPARTEDLAIFGFPRGRPNGVWKSDVESAGPMVGGWSQLKGTSSGDYRLQHGFSGCPVIDASGEILGIFAQGDDDPSVDAGAYIPVSVAAATAAAAGGRAVLPIVEPTGAASVATMDATAVFVGLTRRGPLHDALVTSWQEFLEVCGEPLALDESYLGVAVRGFFENGGEVAYVIRVLGPDSARASVEISTVDAGQNLTVTARDLGAWGNGILVTVREGARQGVRISIAKRNAKEAGALQGDDDDARIVVEDYDNLSCDDGGPNPILQRVGSSDLVDCRWRDPTRPGAMPLHGAWALFGGAAGAPRVRDYVGDAHSHGGISALHRLNTVGLACVPDADHPRLTEGERREIIQALVETCEETQCLAIVAAPMDVVEVDRIRSPTESRAAAVFFPAIRVAWHGLVTDATVTPVGHIAGAIARNDLARGVHVSAVGLELRGVAATDAGDAVRVVHDAEGDLLVRRGINPVRVSATGTVTLSSAQTAAIEEEWRPLQVVRTTFMIERAIDNGLAWTAFAPNDPNTWERVRTQLEEYFTRLWKRGVLVGLSPKQAFFVRCDDTTMTADDIANRRLIVQIGLGFTDGNNRLLGPLELRVKAPA